MTEKEKIKKQKRTKYTVERSTKKRKNKDKNIEKANCDIKRQKGLQRQSINRM